MAEPYLSEIRIFPFAYAPKFWALCNGQALQIRQFPALFSLVGTVYGGDGKTTFGLPNLQGNVAVGLGQGTGLASYALGQAGGTTTVTLTSQQMPAHNHALQAAPVRALSNSPANAVLARTQDDPSYQSSNAGLQALNAQAIPTVGGGGPHNNMMPTLVLNFCICVQGLFPQRQ